MSEPLNIKDSPIKSGWRGNQQGFVEDCNNTHVQVTEITLRLDHETAYALCNVLTDSELEKCFNIENDQRKSLETLGAAIGRLIDHSAANNSGRNLIK